MFLHRSAKRLLDQIVEKGRPAPGFHHGDGPGNAVQEIMIPASKAGLVIGKGGETIKQLQVYIYLFFKCVVVLGLDLSEYCPPFCWIGASRCQNGYDSRWSTEHWCWQAP